MMMVVAMHSGAGGGSHGGGGDGGVASINMGLLIYSLLWIFPTNA